MGQQCCHFEDWDHLKIEASYKVEKDSPLSMPCCNSKKQYVVRDEENGQHVKNIDVLFDEVDNILSSSALTPLWFILPILIGGISHGIMFAYEAAGYLYWIPWVLPNALLIQPMWWYYISKRSCGLKNAINKWNRLVECPILSYFTKLNPSVHTVSVKALRSKLALRTKSTGNTSPTV